MIFETLVGQVGYWMAVRITLTFIGIDFTSDSAGEESLQVKSEAGRFILWHNDAGNMEPDLGLRQGWDIDHEEIRIAKGIEDTFQLLCSIRRLVEGDIKFDDITDSYQ